MLAANDEMGRSVAMLPLRLSERLVGIGALLESTNRIPPVAKVPGLRALSNSTTMGVTLDTPFAVFVGLILTTCGPLAKELTVVFAIVFGPKTVQPAVTHSR